jgi:hypothetical protein
MKEGLQIYKVELPAVPAKLSVAGWFARKDA